MTARLRCRRAMYRLKQGEKSFYKDINKRNDIRFPILVDVALPQHKVSLIIQAKLGGLVLQNGDKSGKSTNAFRRQLELDAVGILGHGRRLVRCLVDIYLQHNDAVAVKSSLELARGIAAGA